MAGKKGVGASAPTQINVVNAEALRVGPDEVLIIRFPLDLDNDAIDMLASDFMEHLEGLGLKDRSVIIFGDAEFAVVKKDG